MSNVPPPPPPGYGGEQPGYGGQPAYGSPPPPGYGAPPPYVQPGAYGAPGYPTNSREHPSGTTVLVLGILGLVLCSILSPIAWVKGNSAMREMNAQPQVYWSNKGNVTAGRICGIIGTCLLGLALLVVVIAIVAAAASSS